MANKRQRQDLKVRRLQSSSLYYTVLYVDLQRLGE
jgi:hypothetical protein